MRMMPLFVQVFQRFFADVGNIVRDFFRPQLGVARFDFMLLDVNGRELVIAHQAFADQDRVFVVAAFP